MLSRVVFVICHVATNVITTPSLVVTNDCKASFASRQWIVRATHIQMFDRILHLIRKFVAISFEFLFYERSHIGCTNLLNLWFSLALKAYSVWHWKWWDVLIKVVFVTYHGAPNVISYSMWWPPRTCKIIYVGEIRMINVDHILYWY